MIGTGKQVAAELSVIATRAEEVLARLAHEREEIERAVQAVQAERASQAAELAETVLPELSAEALLRARRSYAYGGFERRDPLRALPKEAAALQAELTRIEGNETWQRREALVGPYGSITRSLVEVGEFLATWQESCEPFESLDGFLHLVEISYDTPDFRLRWWAPEYWRAWAQGDAVCAALQMADFGDDVLPAYEKVRAPRDSWRAEVQRVTAERDAVLGLVQKHDEVQHRLQNLPALYLQECRLALARHLEQADAALMASWNSADPVASEHLRRIEGLGAKVQILSQLDEGIRALAERCEELGSNGRAQAEKLRRPKNYNRVIGNPPKVQKMASVIEKASQAADKSVTIRERILRFADYQRFPAGEAPELWYILMVGRGASRLTAHLGAWYERHPEALTRIPHPPAETHERRTVDEPDPLSALAVGYLAGRAHDGLGDLS